MITSNPCRKLLMKLANNANLTACQLNELATLLEKHCPSATPFVNWIKESYETLSDCPPSVKALVRAISASSPVCGFIRPNERVHALMRELISGIDVFSCPDKVTLLHEECPAVFAALRDLTSSILPRAWCPMFEELLKRSLAPFTHNSNVQCSSSTSPAAVNVRSESEELCFFPSLPFRRPRGVFLADAARRKEEIWTKKHPAHSFFLPGIFTLFCPHGKFGLALPLTAMIYMYTFF